MIRFSVFISFSAAIALAVPTAVLVAAPVALSQSTGFPPAAMTTLAARAKVSASLSETSFQASRVGSVRLSYSFSKRSKHFSYRLTFKNGATWQTVDRVKKTGRFTGSHSVSVKKLFAGEPVNVGSYRLRLKADRGGTTLAFTVTSAPPAVVKPEAGSWGSTSLSGPVGSGMPTVTRVNFTVGSDQSTVSGMAFGYEFSGYGCSSGSSGMTSGDSTPITDGQFTMNPSGPWTGPVVGSLQGTFDTPTSAHGTGKMWGSMWCMGPTGYNMLMSGSTGTFSWTATTQ